MSKALFAIGAGLLSWGLLLGLFAQDNVTPSGINTKDLVQYVRTARKAGLNDLEIERVAERAGWPVRVVKDAIASEPAPTQSAAAAEPGNPGQPPPVPVPTAKQPGETAAPDSSVKPAEAVNRGVPDDYRIGSGDVVHVNVWGEPTASVTGAVVRTDGKISMPLIHEIYILGMTPPEAEKAISEQLSRFINAPDVAVIISGINSKKIYVTGQVKKEGTLLFTYRMTVMQAISEAGGLTPYAKRKKIYVLRNEDGRDFKLPFDYDAVLKGEHMEMNIPLKPGDQLIVP